MRHVVVPKRWPYHTIRLSLHLMESRVSLKLSLDQKIFTEHIVCASLRGGKSSESSVKTDVLLVGEADNTQVNNEHDHFRR